jgi:hypothetical protein
MSTSQKLGSTRARTFARLVRGCDQLGKVDDVIIAAVDAGAPMLVKSGSGRPILNPLSYK